MLFTGCREREREIEGTRAVEQRSTDDTVTGACNKVNKELAGQVDSP